LGRFRRAFLPLVSIHASQILSGFGENFLGKIKNPGSFEAGRFVE
jgi:hypothetical protein